MVALSSSVAHLQQRLVEHWPVPCSEPRQTTQWIPNPHYVPNPSIFASSQLAHNNAELIEAPVSVRQKPPKLRVLKNGVRCLEFPLKPGLAPAKVLESLPPAVVFFTGYRGSLDSKVRPTLPQLPRIASFLEQVLQGFTTEWLAAHLKDAQQQNSSTRALRLLALLPDPEHTLYDKASDVLLFGDPKPTSKQNIQFQSGYLDFLPKHPDLKGPAYRLVGLEAPWTNSGPYFKENGRTEFLSSFFELQHPNRRKQAFASTA